MDDLIVLSKTRFQLTIMRHPIFLLLFLFFRPLPGFSQTGVGFNLNYQFLHSGSLVADKNFYLLTVLDKDPILATMLRQDSTLSFIMESRKKDLVTNIDGSHPPLDLLLRFLLNHNDSIAIDSALGACYNAHP